MSEKPDLQISEHEQQLRRYINLLAEANKLARLTGPSDEETLWNDHVLDCAQAIALLPKAAKIIDVGTGGGLPGVVWAICRPDIDVTLLDSTTRKCALLQKIVEALGIKNARVVCARSEDYAKERREKFKVAAARAVTSAGVLAELLSPLVKIGGQLIAFKGPKVVEELETVGNKWSELGLSSPKLTPYNLGEMKRFLLIWKKAAQAPKGVPRRPGMAEKFPWYQRHK